jgi:hypothetical protein
VRRLPFCFAVSWEMSNMTYLTILVCYAGFGGIKGYAYLANRLLVTSEKLEKLKRALITVCGTGS